MKKILSLASALALTLPLLAGVVTFKPGDFSGQGVSGTGGAISTTKNGVTVACDKGFGDAGSLRCYKNSKLTITSTSKISTIDFTFESSSYKGGLEDQVTVDGTEWTNTMTAQGRFTQIAVTIEAEVEPEKVDTFSVSQTLARFADGKKGDCYVKGKVTQIMTNGIEQYGNISYWLADIDTPTDSVQGFRMKAAGNKAYSSPLDVEFSEGDEILVYAVGLQDYTKEEEGSPTIIELNTGYYVRTLKGKEIVKLDWATPYASATFEANKWTLEIAKANGDNNVLTAVFPSDKKDAIGGYHTLESGSISLNGSNTAIASGFIKLTYKSNGENSNVYAVEFSANVGEKVYRLGAEMDFYAENEEGQTRLKGDRPFVPNEGDTITCAKAKEYGMSEAAKTTAINVTVRGFVTDLFSNGVTFWMDDQKGSAKTVQAFSCTLPAGKALQNGDEVFVTGPLKQFNNNAEIENGVVVIISGGVDIKPVEVTVAQALTAAQALENGKTSTETYAITGYITSIKHKFGDKGNNMSFWMSDTKGDGAESFLAYLVSCDAELAKKLAPGAQVKVTAKIQHYYSAASDEHPEELHTYETVKGGAVELLVESAVDIINADVKVVKFIENGQIYILRNGVRYNLQGQIAE